LTKKHLQLPKIAKWCVSEWAYWAGRRTGRRTFKKEMPSCVPDRVPRQFQDYKRGGMEVSNWHRKLCRIQKITDTYKWILHEQQTSAVSY